ncbi:MAG TPA: helix-turn-helix transcriptional regulator [Leptolinea sp.]
MASRSQIKTLRAHKIAALVLDARLYARRTLEEACALLAWDTRHLLAIENATITPSMPELEALAAIYAVPVDHFFGSTSLSDEMPKLRVETMQQRLELRNRILGAMIMQARTRHNLSRDDLSLQTGISIEQITQYELGQVSVPVTDMEDITTALQIDLTQWIDSYAIPTRATSFKSSQLPAEEETNLEVDDHLSKELVEFITNPVNKQYLMLASNLSHLPADQLRRIAESLLEITF